MNHLTSRTRIGVLLLSVLLLLLCLISCEENAENTGDSATGTETTQNELAAPYNRVAEERYAVLGYTLYRMTYNTDGHLLGEYALEFNYPDFEPVKNQYEYDENGRFVAYWLGDLRLAVTWEEDGSSARVKGYDVGTCHEIVFRYDEQGRLCEKSVAKGEKPYGITTVLHRYDEEERLIQAGDKDIGSYENGISHTAATIRDRTVDLALLLTEDGRPSMLHDTRLDITFFSWQYNDEGKLIGSEGYCPMGQWQKQALTTLTYDEAGRRSTVAVRMNETNPETKHIVDITYEYAADGTLETETKRIQKRQGEDDTERVAHYRDGRAISSEQTYFSYKESEGKKTKWLYHETEYDAFGDSLSGYSEQYNADGSIKLTKRFTYTYDNLRRRVAHVLESYYADGTLENKTETYQAYHENGYMEKLTEIQHKNPEHYLGWTSETTEYRSDGEASRSIMEWEYTDDANVIHRIWSDTTTKRRGVPLHREYKCWFDGEIAAESVTNYDYADEAHDMWSGYTEQSTYYENYNRYWYDEDIKTVFDINDQTFEEDTKMMQTYIGGVLRSESYVKSRPGRSIVDGVTTLPQAFHEDVKTYDENGTYLGREVMEHTHDEEGHRLKTEGSLYAADGTHQRDYVILYDKEGNFVSSTK